MQNLTISSKPEVNNVSQLTALEEDGSATFRLCGYQDANVDMQIHINNSIYRTSIIALSGAK